MASSVLRLSEKQRNAAGRVSYLGRLLDVLELVGAEHERPLGLTEITQQTGIPLSTVSRLLALLSERHFVRRLPSGRYTPGPALFQIALRGLAGLGDIESLEATVRSISRATGESASAGLLIDDQIVLVARRESEHLLRIATRVGDVVQPHVSAMGKAVLAHLEPARRLELLAAAVGPEADGILRWLTPELDRIRADGFACDEATFVAGLRCRAAPIIGYGGAAIGAISVAGPASRFTLAAAEAAIPKLLAETAALSLDSGATA